MKNIVLLHIVILISVGDLVSAQKLESKEKAVIHHNAYLIIQSYEEVLNKIANDISSNQNALTGHKDQLMNLFLNRKVSVYNDLDPSRTLSKAYEIESYISNLFLWYPYGLEVYIDKDNIISTGIYKHKGNIWYVDINAVKNIKGNYMNKTLNNSEEQVSFRIAFIMENNQFKNFKIVGIRDSKAQSATDDKTALLELNKDAYSDTELEYVRSSSKSLVLDYIRALQLIGNPNEKESDKELYMYDFLSLFESEENKVLNDLEENPTEELLSVKQYISKFIKDFPNGVNNLSLSADSAQYTHIEKLNDDDYVIYVYGDKFLNAKKNKGEVNIATPVIFTVAFKRKDNAFQNFLIRSIDLELTDFKGITQMDEGQKQKEEIIKLITREGSSIEFKITGGLSNINNPNMTDKSANDDLETWKINQSFGFNAGVQLNRFFNKNFGLYFGLNYSYLKTTYNLDGTFYSNSLYPDPNEDKHEKRITVQFDSTVILNYFGAPLGFQYVYDGNGNLSYFVQAGINLQYLAFSQYQKSGFFDSHGYYAERAPALQNIYEEELGFRNESNIEDVGKPELNSINLSSELSFGVVLNTGYYSYFKIGPKIIYGLTSVVNSTEYTNIFGESSVAKPTRTMLYGLEVTFVYSL